MEANLQRRMTGLNEKIPDIQKTLDTVKFLQIRRVRIHTSFESVVWVTDLEITQDESEPIETTFELNDTLYARANIPPTEEVQIWLGVRTKEFTEAQSSRLGRAWAYEG